MPKFVTLGENGTGKDVIARHIYHHSTRYGRPFVHVDLGSIPESLFESELFGYEKGAFTDARQPKAGRMETANGGVLFLDEIGNLSPAMQSKLLTAIEKKRISRLGSTGNVSIDVRILSATNADVRRMVAEGDFRQDLLYRINTVEIHIPPLRERGEDVLLLADFFLEKYARKYGKSISGVGRDAAEKLREYTWPGNVRELQHSIERAVILCDSSRLSAADFALQPIAPRQSSAGALTDTLNLEQLERRAVERALQVSGGNLSRAAELLGITRYSLYRKMAKMGL